MWVIEFVNFLSRPLDPPKYFCLAAGLFPTLHETLVQTSRGLEISVAPNTSDIELAWQAETERDAKMVAFLVGEIFHSQLGMWRARPTTGGDYASPPDGRPFTVAEEVVRAKIYARYYAEQPSQIAEQRAAFVLRLRALLSWEKTDADVQL